MSKLQTNYKVTSMDIMGCTYDGFNSNFNISIPQANELTTQEQDALVNVEKISSTDNPELWYGKNWVVMQNRLIYAVSHLTLDERRVFLWLTSVVREGVKANPEQRVFSLNIKDFMEGHKVKSKRFYGEGERSLEDICYKLQSKSINYWLEDKNEVDNRAKGRVQFISDTLIKTRQGWVDVEIPTNMVRMLTIFNKENPFTKFQWDLVVDLGGNGLIMLELLSSIIWEKKKQFTVEHIRAKFDCTDTYPAIGEFNRQVINKAISDVNEHTDIVARYETIAAGGGKKITHYIFHAAKKPKAIKKNNQKTTDEDGQSIERKLGKLKKGLSDAQIKKLATRKDDFIQVNLHMVKPNTSSFDTFEQWKPLLKDKEHVNQFYFVKEFLNLTKNDTLPADIEKYKGILPTATEESPTPSKKGKVGKNINALIQKGLTNQQIEQLISMEGFVDTFHGGNFGHQSQYPKGSDKHIKYLKFWLSSHLQDFFIKKDFFEFYKNLDEVQEEQSKGQ